jgi:hypothetical protein
VTQLAVLSRAVADGAAPTRVMYFRADDTYLLLDCDAPENPADYQADLVPCCLSCILDRGGERIGQGMDVAQRTGEARREGDTWREVAQCR